MIRRQHALGERAKSFVDGILLNGRFYHQALCDMHHNFSKRDLVVKYLPTNVGGVAKIKHDGLTKLLEFADTLNSVVTTLKIF